MNSAIETGARCPWRWTRRSVLAIGALFLVFVVAAAAYDIARHRRLVIEDTGRELDAQARVLAEQVARSAGAVDAVLRRVAHDSRRGRFAAASPRQLTAYLDELSVALTHTEGLRLYGARGELRAGDGRILGVPILDRAFLREVRSGAAGRDLLGPVRRTPGGQYVVELARRLETSSSAFAGVVVAGLRIGEFEQLFRDAGLAAETEVMLLRPDGTLVARFPRDEALLGERIAPLAELLAGRDASGPDAMRHVSPIDGVERFAAARAVPGYPLEVLVGRSTAATLASWAEVDWGTAIRTVAVTVLAALLLWVAQRQFARLEQAGRVLEGSRRRFALAAAGANDGIIDWDVPGNRIYASARAQEILAVAPGPEWQSREGWLAALRLHPADEPRWRADVQAHLEGRTAACSGEYRVASASGNWRWVRFRGLCVRDDAGAPTRMAGSVADIDARQRAEDSLRQSEERYALAMTGSNEGHWVWDLATDHLFVSPKMNEIFGLPSDTTPSSRTDYVAQMPIHAEDRARVGQAIDDHLQGRSERYDIEYRIVTARGEVRWVHARGQCFRDEQGRPVRMAGSNVDVTERKRTEEALRRSEQRYQLAIAGVNQGVWDWDLASDTVFMSARAQQLLGQVPGEPLRPRREWIARWTYHDEDRARVRRAVSDYLRGSKQSFEVEYRMLGGNGEWRWYHDRGVAVRDESGQPIRMAGSIEDVTERKKAEAERDRLEAQLRQAQKLEAIGTLAGGIAHDFNNILAVILGYGEMAQREAAANSDLRRHLDAAVNAGLRAKALVERILAFSRSGMGERMAVHVQSVVAEVLEAVAASLPPEVRFERVLAAADAAVVGDPTQLHQVVMNLCTNAVQALGPEGSVSVAVDTVAFAEPRTLTTCNLHRGDYVRLRVSDTGCGIDPKVIDRIFDPFFTTKEVGAGTGLGLSLVHGIVIDLGGGIDVQSEPGAGSTFTVYLPLQPHAAASSTTAEQPVHAGSGERILLVDDETSLVRLGEEMIAELGYEPVGYSSSLAALETFRAEAHRFDAVLADEAMPGLTGTELAIEMRRIRADVPIVLMSGYATAELATRARAAGVVEVLAKPLLSRDIARSLASALHRTAGDSPSELEAA